MEKQEKFFEVYQERHSLLLYIICCIAFIALALIYIQYANVFSLDCEMREFSQCCFSNPTVYYVIGKGLLGYFGLCLILFLFLLIHPFKLFYLNDEGFWSREYGFINWENISDLNIKTIALKTAICFNVKDKSLLKIPFQNIIFQKINKMIYKREYYISFSNSYDIIYEIFKVMKMRTENV